MAMCGTSISKIYIDVAGVWHGHYNRAGTLWLFRSSLTSQPHSVLQHWSLSVSAMGLACKTILLICGVRAEESTKVSFALWNIFAGIGTSLCQRISIQATWQTVMLTVININGVRRDQCTYVVTNLCLMVDICLCSNQTLHYRKMSILAGDI